MGMKTVAQLRQELGIGPPRLSDSLYGSIDRRPKRFNPLRIPKSLQVCTLSFRILFEQVCASLIVLGSMGDWMQGSIEHCSKQK